ncbi:hypothetical protein SISSUDRAFT_200134 [Sistotremastrum suecicum HHB10207 ss-3]|uniref:Uncharacterized protein n=1 Tax=Sistotremastrum suecicum HHB10207 ss-3 TaxID=1314776 RepID=A0A166A9I8_9AGAM|nr:hypothetical protein SISSUDRAFT_200134 [Sistotremastrum suecicum HHB10207 ss-3]
MSCSRSPSPSSVSFKSTTRPLPESSTSVAIPPYTTTLNTTQHLQDVPVLNSPSVPPHSTHGHQPATALDFNSRSPQVSSNQHASINQSSTRPRTYYTQNVLPTRLPPTPLTTFVKSNTFPHQTQTQSHSPVHQSNQMVHDDMEDLWEKLLTPAQDSEVAFGEYINDSPLIGGDSSPFEDTPYMDTPNQ